MLGDPSKIAFELCKPRLLPILLNQIPYFTHTFTQKDFPIQRHFVQNLTTDIKQNVVHIPAKALIKTKLFGLQKQVLAVQCASSYRIPPALSFFFFFFSSSVTLRVPPLYLGNQVWYHRSAGVKTTGKKF